LAVRCWSAYWDWLWGLNWYLWPVVALGLGVVGFVSDVLVWGVAVVIWEAVTGRVAFPDRPARPE
jgi:hypothetical protein